MDNFAAYDPIKDIHFEPCYFCHKSAMWEIARADSLFFRFVTHHLLKCEDANCDAFAWASSIANQGEPTFGAIILNKKQTKLPHQGSIFLRTVPIKTPTELPTEVASDFHEAMKCYNAEAYVACVAMFRRVLERALIDRGAKPKAKLSDMIKDLVDEGELPLETEMLCEEIRLYGNPASHADEIFSQKEANVVLQFTDAVLAWLYGNVIPVNRQKADSN